MGSSHSHTNVLGKDNATVGFTENDAEVCWGDSNSNSIQMSKSTDGRGMFPRWSMAYTICSKSCLFSLDTSEDSVNLGLKDGADNPCQLEVKIRRKGISGLGYELKSNGTTVQLHSINKYKNFLTETLIFSYCRSQREGLFVVETRKNSEDEDPYLVTLAHCYVTQDVGLSVVAEVRNRWNEFWFVEVKGPYEHPAKDLLKVLDETRNRRVWSPAACPHCCPTHYLGLVNNHGNNQGSSSSDDQLSCADKLDACVRYFGSPNPAASCCNAIKQTEETQLPCLCKMFSAPEAFENAGLNYTEAVQLTHYCGITTDVTTCKAIPGNNTAGSGKGNGQGGLGKGNDRGDSSKVTWTRLYFLLFLASMLFN